MSVDVSTLDRMASARTINRHRCKRVHVRGGREFRCELMGKHPSRDCLIKTKSAGYVTVPGTRSDSLAQRAAEGGG